MKIESARYVRNSGYPELHLTIDGQSVVIDWEQKMLARGHSCVYIGLEGLPPMNIPFENGFNFPMNGFTDNPTVVKLTRDFLTAIAAGTFEVGPVEVPAPAPPANSD